MGHRKNKGRSAADMRETALFTREILHNVASPTVIDNAAELVDAELMLQRVKDGNELSCTFVTYDRNIVCAVSSRKYSLQDMCTCEASYFCRHAAALVLTFIEHPESFVDLESYLDDLAARPQEELLEMLRRMIGRYPASSLEVLGEPGFQPADVLEEMEDELFPFGDEGGAEDLLDCDLESDEIEEELGFDDDDDFDGPGHTGGLN